MSRRVVYKACAASWDIVLREHGGKDQLVLTAATGQVRWTGRPPACGAPNRARFAGFFFVIFI